MNKQVNLGAAWQAMLKQAPEQWDLTHAALLIAAELESGMDMQAYEQQLAAMADAVHSRISDDMSVNERIREINTYFYVDSGFAGDRKDYYLPDNSLLNHVLERRRGIPIALAVVYLKLATTAGLDAFGIGFPGHYLVGIRDGKKQIVLDPFNQGQVLDHQQLRDMLQQFSQQVIDEAALERNLQPASHTDTVVRMLRNLKQIYIEAQQVELALTCIEMILSILPESPDELRDRGMIYQHIEYTQGAINDLTLYLKLVPDAEERGVIEALLDSLQTQHKSLH
ncbi:MAG: tetratricopeptide repeat protein [Gammaproteobacteria bacterium]|jgi:regulator of sirC expression with transglutaminase-like and TPR domain